jgi:hypothetical protein
MEKNDEEKLSVPFDKADDESSLHVRSETDEVSMQGTRSSTD